MNAYLIAWNVAGLFGIAAAALVLRARTAYTPYAFGGLGLAWAGFVAGSKLQFQLEHYPLPEALLLVPSDLASPGHHTPLGLVIGALFACLYCRIVALSARAMMDALAVGASLMMAVGRVGCFVNGCCTGAVCATWLPFVCARHPPGSEPYGLQLARDLIPWDSPSSLPVHPLPLYFGATATLTLVILLWLLRRGAPAGLLGVTFGIIEPIGKLTLETLRGSASDGPHGLMLAVPLSMLTASLSWVGVSWIGGALTARRRRWRPRAAARAAR